MTIKDKKSTNWHWNWDSDFKTNDSLFEILSEITNFGHAIRTIRKAHNHTVVDMGRLTDVDYRLLSCLESGIVRLPYGVDEKICVGYQLSQEDDYALRQAFRKTKIKEEQWEQKPESYFWYIEEHQPSSQNNNGIGGGPFLDIDQAISVAQFKVVQPSTVYVFSVVEDYRPGSGIIAYKNIVIRFVETFAKSSASGIIQRKEMMTAKERFIERLKNAVEIRQKQQEQDQFYS